MREKLADRVKELCPEISSSSRRRKLNEWPDGYSEDDDVFDLSKLLNLLIGMRGVIDHFRYDIDDWSRYSIGMLERMRSHIRDEGGYIYEFDNRTMSVLVSLNSAVMRSPYQRKGKVDDGWLKIFALVGNKKVQYCKIQLI